MITIPSIPIDPITVRGTELLAGDTRERYRQKLARITLDSMVQFVGLLNAKGTVLEINQVALDAVGIGLSDVEGMPFWTTFWWQVSDDINRVLRESILRAAQGEFVRWDTEIYGRASGKETIVIDASLCPVKDERGNVVFITAEGRDITEKKAQEREIARQREELAKLDELKTQFFANISHEFRTPLTLMLGPLGDAMTDGEEPLGARQRERMLMVQRNGLRLQKLVNALLDFSRVEAGRIQSVYQPTDLAALTSDLVSSFRSACEKAGLTLAIDAAALPEPVFVDREMWEKIVLNLVSNAFKFTFEGGIAVVVQAEGEDAVLRVGDTGTGIPEAEAKLIFERFHRVEGARGRTHEGTGIGLALVRELVKLHKGSVAVESTLGKGTMFTVRVPFGSAHLPQERIGGVRDQTSTATRADAFLSEALRWLPDDVRPDDVVPGDVDASDGAAVQEVGAERARILFADDNADMRDYVRRLLAPHHDVIAMADGEEALREIRRARPDLVVTDVMMPLLDGFELLQRLRATPELRDIPVIVLSARAGEEARIEGLQRGADDYLVKPFGARELLARVVANLRLSRTRAEFLRRERHNTGRLQKLSAAFLAVTAAADLDARLRAISEHARLVIGAHMSVVGLTSGPDWSQSIQAKSLSDDYARYRAYDTVPDGTGIYALACETNRPVRLTEAELHAHPRWRGFGRHAAEHPRLRGWLVAPLIGSDGGNLGLIQLADKYDGEFDEADESMLVQLAQLASVAVERDNAENAIRRLNATLEQRVADEITARLKTEEALRQAQKMEAIGQLTGGIAHDFNNLLQVMLGNLDILHRRMSPADGDELHKPLAAAVRGGQRAAQLTHQLLAFARRQPLAPVAADLGTLIMVMSELLRRTLGEKIEVETVLPGGLWKSSVDVNQLESAILNLAVNARDAMPHGGRLTIETRNVCLDESYAAAHSDVAPGQYVLIAVGDTGTGMRKELIEKAFEPFFTTKEIGRGTGLGLSQVYGFVKQSGGHVKIESELGRGTVVKIYLPRLTGEAVEVQPAETVASAPRAAAGDVVLVVEDDEDVRSYTTEMLRELAYEVIEAPNAATALRLLDRHHSIKLLFTDVGLPGGMNGRQLADEAVRRRPGLKVLFTTGYARDAIVHHGRLDSGVELIPKPFTYSGLAAKLRTVLSR